VSPLINGKAVKGPAEKIMTSLGMQADAIGIASFYGDLIDTIIIDNVDSELSPKIRTLGIEVFCTDILMSNSSEKKRLAEEILFLAKNNNLPEGAKR
jgi:LPPG:FO 2-phospho-L-lactate transferase